MLDDRKFYFPISAKEPESAGPAQPGPFRNMRLRTWRPVGANEIVAMDKDEPFVGQQSPCIQLDLSSTHGIRQSGLTLVKGKKYTGRIYLRGTPGAKVQVALVWGQGGGERQTLSLTPLSM